MSGQLGSVEICCDDPPYAIVQACRHIHIESPEDVRWLRMSAFRSRQNSGEPSPWSLLWEMLLGSGKQSARTCTCGEPLPELRLVEFRFDPGNVAAYLLGQCHRCRTVFWDDL
jgi:hypothetical protein